MLTRRRQQIFDALGFRVERTDKGDTLQPPCVGPAAEGRGRLLRAWVELSAWAADYATRFRACIAPRPLRGADVL